MKQIINIQLGGRNITIEDAAAKKIQDYLEELRKHFSNENGREEIIADIESRFSELMFEKLRKGAPHITDADVEEMIATMGRPQDFEEGTTTESTTATETEPHLNFSYGDRKLYRDNNNQMLGGVCGGLAHWINVDPSIIRLLFAIVAFGSFGIGLLIYILLWIFLPVRNLEGYKGKRLFRDPDNKKIGGVASGLAAYFGKPAGTIRLIFLAPFLLSLINGLFNGPSNNGDFNVFSNVAVGSLCGTFLTAYIILWIVLPEAISTYEKMEMHGRPVDLNSIKDNVQQSMGGVKDRMKSWSKEVQDTATKFGRHSATYGQNFGREFGQVAGRSAKGIGHGIAVIIKAFFIIIAGTIIFSLFVAFLTVLFSGYAFAPFNNFLWTSENQQFLAWGTVLLLMGAPIVGGVIWLVRMVLNVTTPGAYLNYLFGGLWAIGWIFLVFFIASISKDFKRTETTETEVSINQPSGKKMILTVSQPELEYHQDFGWVRNGGAHAVGISLNKDTLKLSDISVQFEKSSDSFYHAVIERQAFGNTDEDAKARLNKIQYTVSLKDSVLDLQSGFAVDKNSKYRFQRVAVIVKVPVGAKVQLDPSINEKLNAMDFDGQGDRGGVQGIRRRRNYKNYASNTEYTMTADGRLKSANETVTTKSSKGGVDTGYRWTGAETNEKNNSQNVENKDYRYDNGADSTGKTDSATYRYNDGKPGTSNNSSKEELNKLLKQKEKELEELKKKIGR